MQKNELWNILAAHSQAHTKIVQAGMQLSAQELASWAHNRVLLKCKYYGRTFGEVLDDSDFIEWLLNAPDNTVHYDRADLMNFVIQKQSLIHVLDANDNQNMVRKINDNDKKQ